MTSPRSPSRSPSSILAIDTGSPLVSIAYGAPGEVRSALSMARADSSEALLRGIDEVLRQAEVSIRDVDGLVALRGPGSFTGLRVGLATVLGLHQALGVPATAMPTLEVLGLTVAPGPEPVVAVVDALRDEWFAQRFADGRALEAPRILTTSELSSVDAARLVRHGFAGDGQGVESPAREGDLEPILVSELAPLALDLLGRAEVAWSEATLLDPLYLRQPAVHGA